MHAVGCC